MSRFIDNAEFCLDQAKESAYSDALRMWAYLISAVVWTLIEIADAIRYSHE